MLFPDLAKKIVREVRRLISENIIIVGANGIIIASTDPTRLGTFHEGALLCLQQKKTVIITKEDEHKLQGVKAGISLPLLFHDEVVGVIGITGKPEDISQYGEIMRKMTELLIHENYFLEQLELEQRSYEAFVFDWLQRREWSPSFLDRAKALGVTLEGRQRLILLALHESDPLLQRKVWQYMHPLLPKQDLLVRWGNERLILVHAVGEEDAKETAALLNKWKQDAESAFPVKLAVGIGQTMPAKRMHTSYEQALRALEVALPTHAVVFHENLRLEMCLQDISGDTREEFLKRTLYALVYERELFEALQAFIGCNQSYKLAAEQLHIHINTLHYRFKKIEEATGLNPKRFEDLATLYVALRLLENSPKKPS
ncbi:CdaR family transcriptional regulator [Ectobacillus ponti]|uniref:Helix-turn-helix domain-containing protein n=1 Tax=Ectobacillus ponti TaxID=2961894 RepID=A0AA41X3X9_9BACI|nr:sugar diacid recognition domain-containing protein [Ectobacillus ponti]MCP8968481.1 helix-turn-helix domain-containing protein [Ectobacillus ponti]